MDTRAMHDDGAGHSEAGKSLEDASLMLSGMSL
jgi:hypothetical protein